MREIKFRVWDKKKKRFVPLDGAIEMCFSNGKLIVGETIEYGTHEEFNGFELLEYTGLKDKTGKEIYEGDILRYKLDESSIDPENPLITHDIGVVVYEETQACFFLEIDEDSAFPFGMFDRPFEIIGSIYETTDEQLEALLK